MVDILYIATATTSDKITDLELDPDLDSFLT